MRPPDMYPRGYRYSSQEEFAPAAAGREASALLLSRVSFLTVGMLFCTALGAWLFALMPSTGLFWIAAIATFVMVFVCQAVARRFPLNLAMLALFAGLEGMVLAPLLLFYARLPGGPMIIVQAALLSAVIFGMVGTLGWTSSRSYAHWIPWLIGGLFLLILVGVIGAFVSLSPGVNLLFTVAGAALFIVFTFVDFTRIRHDYGPEDYVPATMQVYLDLILLFQYILMLLGGNDRRRD